MAHNLIAGLAGTGAVEVERPASSQVCLWPQMETNQGAIYVH